MILLKKRTKSFRNKKNFIHLQSVRNSGLFFVKTAGVAQLARAADL